MVSLLSEFLILKVGPKITNRYHLFLILWDLLYDDHIYTLYIQGYHSIYKTIMEGPIAYSFKVS